MDLTARVTSLGGARLRLGLGLGLRRCTLTCILNNTMPILCLPIAKLALVIHVHVALINPWYACAARVTGLGWCLSFCSATTCNRATKEPRAIHVPAASVLHCTYTCMWAWTYFSVTTAMKSYGVKQEWSQDANEHQLTSISSCSFHVLWMHRKLHVPREKQQFHCCLQDCPVMQLPCVRVSWLCLQFIYKCRWR